jgi:NTP pyrophosphatase (non-canonical NTP hydrolase)
MDSPINTLQQLMAITAEECGELTQACMKIIRRHNNFVIEPKWRENLVEEAGDVLCMIELMVDHGLLTNDELGARVNVKRNKLKTWSTLIDD